MNVNQVVDEVRRSQERAFHHFGDQMREAMPDGTLSLEALSNYTAFTARFVTPCNKKRDSAIPRFPVFFVIGGGNYYASAKVARKVIRRSLETGGFNVAKNRLPAALSQ